MKPCKAKLSDGKPCPNQVDEGQEYCFYHLASQDADEKKKLSIAVDRDWDCRHWDLSRRWLF